MNIYDAAHNLARAIKNSNEYNDLREKHKRAFSNPKTRDILNDFRSKAMELQRTQMEGKVITEEMKNDMVRFEDVMMKEPAIKDFFNAEMKFSQTMKDIYKIIGESIDLNIE